MKTFAITKAMKDIIFVTGSEYKFDVAKKTLAGSDFELIQQELETPEIQSMDVAEVASYSAKWTSEKLQKTAAVTDAGCYISALNGFPGPFIKWVNKWISAEDFLNLMKGKDDRSVEVRACLGYCEPGAEPVIFTGVSRGKLSLAPGVKGITPIDEIFIPEGYDKPSSEIPWDEMAKFWSKGADSTWTQLAEYLKKK